MSILKILKRIGYVAFCSVTLPLSFVGLVGVVVTIELGILASLLISPIEYIATGKLSVIKKSVCLFELTNMYAKNVRYLFEYFDPNEEN